MISTMTGDCQSVAQTSPCTYIAQCVQINHVVQTPFTIVHVHSSWKRSNNQIFWIFDKQRRM